MSALGKWICCNLDAYNDYASIDVSKHDQPLNAYTYALMLGFMPYFGN